MSYPFIVLEGVDGTGKSTISKLLAQEISAISLATPLEPHRSNRPQFNPETFIPEDHFAFYLESVEFASEQIDIVRQVMPVVCDRYWLSTYAYHVGLGMDENAVKEGIAKSNIIQPDATFLLECDNEVLKERMRKRGSRQLREEWLSKIRNTYASFNLNTVDTTNLTINEVVAEIKKRLIMLNLIKQEA